jgi:hypothetical protein
VQSLSIAFIMSLRLSCAAFDDLIADTSIVSLSCCYNPVDLELSNSAFSSDNCFRHSLFAIRGWSNVLYCSPNVAINMDFSLAVVVLMCASLG